MIPSQITCRGARIRKIDVRRKDSNHYARVGIACDFSDQLALDMGWDDIMDGGHPIECIENNTGLVGDLRLRDACFQVNGTDKSTMLRAQEARDFSYHRTKDGEGTKFEIFFTLVTDDDITAISHWKAFGPADHLLVMRTVDGQQMNLGDGTADTAEAGSEPACYLCDDEQELNDSATAHVMYTGDGQRSEVPCPAGPRPAPGGTRGRRKHAPPKRVADGVM